MGRPPSLKLRLTTLGKLMPNYSRPRFFLGKCITQKELQPSSSASKKMKTAVGM